MQVSTRAISAVLLLIWLASTACALELLPNSTSSSGRWGLATAEDKTVASSRVMIVATSPLRTVADARIDDWQNRTGFPTYRFIWSSDDKYLIIVREIRKDFGLRAYRRIANDWKEIAFPNIGKELHKAESERFFDSYRWLGPHNVEVTYARTISNTDNDASRKVAIDLNELKIIRR